MNRRTLIVLSLLVTLLMGLVGCNSPQTAPESSDSTGFQAMAVNTWETKSLGGFSNVAVYTPSTTSAIGPSGKQALLIVLHGCTQAYTAFKTANLETVATQYGMVIAAPDAQYKAGFQCWDYWGATKSRTSGDYANLINLAKYFTTNANVDPAQVYIAGLSSGGAFAMTTACLAPDIFAGMGIDAGPSAGTSSNGAFSHESTAAQTATRCEGFAGSYASHFDTQLTVTAAGTSDNTVPQSYAPQNAEAMAIIYGGTAGTSATTSYGKEKLWSLGGKTIISQLTLNGVGHAWPGGSGASGSYIDGTSINFGLYLAEFFLNNNRRVSRDNVAPVVSITSPANGANVSGTVTIAATATDDVAMEKVEFYVNGVLKGTDTSSPYAYSWNTSSLYTGTYTLVAKAYDTSGNTKDATVSVSVQGATDTVLPSVSISSPANGATVTANVAITAAASDAETGVAKVEFFIDGVKISEDTSAPYEASFSAYNYSAAAHTIAAKATDGAGNTKTASISVNVVHAVDCQAWTGTNGDHSLASPARVAYNNASGTYGYHTVGGNDFTGAYLDPVTVYLDTDDNKYYKGDGKSMCGNGTVVEPDTQAPVASITSPANGATVSGTITIQASATDNVAVSKVDFYINGILVSTDTTAPYAHVFDTTTVSNLPHNFYVKAFDAAGNVGTSATIDVTVNNGTPDTTAPSTSITAPGAGATLSGTVTLSANATDNVGVSKVEFYMGATKVGEDTSSPYSISYNSTTLANGTYNLTSKAYDAAGNVGTSSAVSVSINNAAGPTTVSFDSISSEDAYVKAYSTGTSPAVVSTGSLAIGRGSDGKFNRSVLSFNTSSLPDSATIVKAYVVVTYSSKYGDPWASSNQLVIDVKNGTFGAATIETTDWAAAPTASAVASIASFSSGTKQSADFSAAGMSAISKTGKTQLKLRFANNQTSTSYIFIKEGASAKLYVEYQ